MALGSTANVRKLAAWPSDTEASDTDITEALTVATQDIQTRTRVTEAQWSTVPYSTFKDKAEDVAEACAASKIVLRVNNPEITSQRSDQLRKACKDGIMELIDSLGTILTDNPGFVDVNQPYTTYPNNLEVNPYDETI